jgi:hypothetical protein
MARKPKAPDIGHNSGGPSKGDVLAADAELMEAKRTFDEAAADFRNVKKRWKKQGVDPALIASLQKDRGQDETERLAREANRRRYAGWMNVKIEPPTDAGAPVEQDATSAEEQAHREAMAKDAGYRCGRLGTDRHAGNTYPPGSPMFDAFDRGYLAGMESIAAEMGPDVKVADSSKKKPALSVVGEQAGVG